MAMHEDEYEDEVRGVMENRTGTETLDAHFHSLFVQRACYVLQGKHLIRPDYLYSYPSGEIREMLERRHWEYFGRARLPYSPLVIQEFYAFGSIHTEAIRFTLRGHHFDFTEELLREMTGFPVVEDCHYQLLSGLKDTGEQYRWRDIIQSIAPGAEVPQISWIHPDFLSPRARQIYDFIRALVWPTGNTNQVPLPQGKLIYALITGRPVDIGRVLYDMIRRRFTVLKNEVQHPDGQRHAPLLYPSLIHSMCARGGIPLFRSEQLTPNPSVWPVEPRGARRPRGEAAAPGEDRAQAAPAPATAAVPPAAAGGSRRGSRRQPRAEEEAPSRAVFDLMQAELRASLQYQFDTATELHRAILGQSIQIPIPPTTRSYDEVYPRAPGTDLMPVDYEAYYAQAYYADQPGPSRRGPQGPPGADDE